MQAPKTFQRVLLTLSSAPRTSHHRVQHGATLPRTPCFRTASFDDASSRSPLPLRAPPANCAPQLLPALDIQEVLLIRRAAAHELNSAHVLGGHA